MSRTPESKHPDHKPTAEQPKWRQDFPIDIAQAEYISRRDFAKFLVLTSGAMAVGQACLVGEGAMRRNRKPYEPQPIAHVSEVDIGRVIRFDYPEPGDSCLLARLEDGKLVAFGQKCTHLSCAVTPDLPNGKFVCPCHNGHFDAATGQPLSGPPRRPLPLITLDVRDDIIYAIGVELRT